ncbi:MAG: JAB domain-containing protein [Ramlibacter sp.]
MPHYHAPPGVLSLRHRMAKHELAVVDAAFAILGRYLREPGKLCNHSEAVEQYLRLALMGEARELFAVLYLDGQHRAIAFETLFIGTLHECSVPPREVVMSAMRHGAAGVVLAHNHPNGTKHPSQKDLHLTETLRAALALVDVRVLDHVIVAGEGTECFSRLGIL